MGGLGKYFTCRTRGMKDQSRDFKKLISSELISCHDVLVKQLSKAPANTNPNKQAAMSAKRKRGDEGPRTDVVSRPVAGTKSFKTGTAVRDGLATGTRQGEFEIPENVD